MAAKTKEPALIERHSLQVIILPEKMSYDQAIESLMRRMQEDEKIVSKQRMYSSWHWRDVFVQVNRAIHDTFGWVDAQKNPGFFGDTPPRSVSIEIAPGQHTECIYGVMGISTWEGQASLQNVDEMNTTLAISVKQKYSALVENLFDLVDSYLQTQSIYKNQAIDSDFNFLKEVPADITKIRFDDDIQASIEASIWTPIKKWELAEKLGLNKKRGVLLVGPYGTGKTLTALATAKLAVENSWTFMYIKTEHTNRFAQILENVLRYAPVVVFLEDVDIVAHGDRDLDMNNILNMMDGIKTKNTKLLVVLSTNRIEMIHPALLRPGRLDAIIRLPYPNLTTRSELLEQYTRRPAHDIDFLEAASHCVDSQNDGYTGATIREVAERATLFAIRDDDDSTVTTDDLKFAADSVRAQVDMTRNEQKPAAPEMDAAVERITRQNLAKALENVNGFDKEEFLRDGKVAR